MNEEIAQSTFPHTVNANRELVCLPDGDDIPFLDADGRRIGTVKLSGKRAVLHDDGTGRTRALVSAALKPEQRITSLSINSIFGLTD